MLRYLAILWDTNSFAQTDTAQSLFRKAQAQSCEWTPILARPGIRVLCSGGRPDAGEPYLLHGDAGVVLGSLFHGFPDDLPEQDAASMAAGKRVVLDEHATHRILASQGRALIQSYWGRYVAFVTSSAGERVWIVRDPTGGLPCNFIQHGGLTLVFSYLGDCAALDSVRLAINWEYVRSHIAGGNQQPNSTALNGICELYAGECLELARGRHARQFYWRPADFINGPIIEDGGTAAARLRATLRACTSAWAAGHGSVLHQTSGGLDSSIVLDCLARSAAKPAITCITHFVPGGPADERPLARLAARSAGADHIEHARDHRLDLRDLFRQAPSVRPLTAFAALETGPVETRTALQIGAGAIFDGTGGDYLFYLISAGHAAADFFWRHGWRMDWLRVASDVALLTDRTVWQVLADAWRSKYRRSEVGSAAERMRHRRLVSREALEDAMHRAVPPHPWLAEPNRVPPGALLPILGLSLPPPFYGPLWTPGAAAVETVSPLLSQPVVQLCLRVPSYTQTEGARDRSVARRAFSGYVPEAILARQWKDRAAGFVDAVLQWNLRFIREVLLDGTLAKERLLDRQRLESVLSGAADQRAPYPLEVLEHLACELWIHLARTTWAQRKRPSLVVSRS